MQRNDGGMWPGYVKNHLLPRLFGFELLMAPYAVAHFKLSLQLAGRDLPVETAREKYNLRKDSQDWKVHLAQEDVLATGPEQVRVTPILYRPFDVRFSYYTGKSRGFICRPRADVMNHFVHDDHKPALCYIRRSRTGRTAPAYGTGCAKFSHQFPPTRRQSGCKGIPKICTSAEQQTGSDSNQQRSIF